MIEVGNIPKSGAFTSDRASPVLIAESHPESPTMEKAVKQSGDQVPLPGHGASVLPSVTVDSCSLEIKDKDGALGDKVSKGAFWDVLDKWRKPLKRFHQDPFGEKPSKRISKRELAALLADGDTDEAGLVQSAAEDFAQRLDWVIRTFLRFKAWRGTECVVIGGGFAGSRIAKLVAGRSALLLKSQGIEIDLVLIENHPDEAGLIGAAHLLPAWMLKGHDAMLALDIGGTNIRAGVVQLNLKEASDLAAARVVRVDVWRHAEDETSREGAAKRIVKMLNRLIAWAEKNSMRLVPVVGIGCPGIIQPDGSMIRGTKNLPGNWESSRFNLPALITRDIPAINGDELVIVMHNDAVVQGLSELPRMRERKRWGVLTIGTGLGNACFTTRNRK
jgi:predicted NBD/HSP70 family sugar kinase